MSVTEEDLMAQYGPNSANAKAQQRQELLQEYQMLKAQKERIDAQRQELANQKRDNYQLTDEDRAEIANLTGIGQEGFFESAVIGAGKAVSDIGTGVKQLVNDSPELRQQVAEERRLMSKIGSPLGAAVGEIGGAVALPGLGAAKVAKALGGGLKGMAAGGATAGALYGGVTPLAPGEERSTNVALGGLTGGVAGATIPAALRGLGAGASALGRKVKEIRPTSKARGIFQRSIEDLPEEQLAQGIQRGQQAIEEGVDLDVGRAIGSQRAMERQQRAFNRLSNDELVGDYATKFDEQLDTQFNKLLGSLSSKEPQGNIFRNIQNVAKSAERQLLKDVKDATTPMYNKLKTENVNREVLGDLTANPVYEKVLSKALKSPGFKVRAGGLKDGDSLNLYQVELLRQKAGEEASKAFRKGNNIDGQEFRAVEQELRGVLSNNSQFFDDAITRYADEINQAKETLGEAGIAKLVNASPERIQQVSEQMLKMPSNRISTLRNLFQKQDGGQEAWNAITARNLQDRLDAIQSKASTNQRLVSLMGKPKQVKEIKAMVRGNSDAEKIMDLLEYVASKAPTKARAPSQQPQSALGIGELIQKAKDTAFSIPDKWRDEALVEMLTNPKVYVKEIERIRKLRAPRSTKRVILNSYLAQIASRIKQGIVNPGNTSSAVSASMNTVGGQNE